MQLVVLSLLSTYFGALSNAQQSAPAAPSVAPSAGPSLAPSQAFTQAMEPFNQARAQPNDLTEADQVALGISVARGAQLCRAISTPDTDAAVSGSAASKGAPADGMTAASQSTAAAGKPTGEEFFSLARLCLLGQQFDLAHAALDAYLTLPTLAMREQALVLQVRALIGMHAPEDTAAPVAQLLSGYPYDAYSQLAQDQAIDAMDSLQPPHFYPASHMCATQTEHALPLIAANQPLTTPDKQANVSPATLVEDALRCVAITRANGETADAETLAKRVLAVAIPLAQTPQGDAVAESIERFQKLGNAQILPLLRAQSVHRTGPLTPLRIPLMQGNIVLVPFTLYASSTPNVLHQVADALGDRKATVYAVTAWAANTGAADLPNEALMATLRAWQQAAPVGVQLVVVPQAEFEKIAGDHFPSGYAIVSGLTAYNAELASEGEVRLMLAGIPKRQN